MNIDDIKKALECCSENTLANTYTESCAALSHQMNICKNCPYYYIFNCNDTLCKDALTLITEQEKKIDQLTEERNRYAATLAKYQMASDKEIRAQIKQAKIDVLNRLKSLSIYDDNYLDGYVFIDDIDKLLEEYENDT